MPAERERFLELAVFPANEITPEPAIATLWEHTGQLDNWETSELLSTLAERSLIQTTLLTPASDGGQRRFSLHDLVYDYVSRGTADPVQLHTRLIEAYAQKCPDGWPSGPNDGYFFSHLRNHLIAAGRAEELADLLLKLRWLEAKNEAGLTFDLIKDFRESLRVMPIDDIRRRNLALLDEALRRDIVFIALHHQDYTQALFQCLWNLCWWYDCPEAANHYEEPRGAGEDLPPWETAELKLYHVLNQWRNEKEKATPGFRWIRSLRPPPNHLAGLLRAVLPHGNEVRDVAFSPDGSLIASVSAGQVHFWEATSNRFVGSLSSVGAGSVAFSPDSTRLVCASGEQGICIWNLSSGRQEVCFGARHGQAISASFSPDEKRIVSCSYPFVHVWDAITGRLLTEIRPEVDGFCPRKAYFNPDGTRIVIAHAQGLRVADASTGRTLLAFPHPGDKIYDAAFNADGTRLVSSCRDGGVRLYDALLGHEMQCLYKHGSRVYSVAFSPDGKHIVSASRDNTVCVYNIDLNEPAFPLRAHTNVVMRAVFSADGNIVASASDDKTVRLWDVSSRDKERHLRGQHRHAIRQVSFSRGGSRLFSLSSQLDWTGREETDISVISWDPEQGTPILLADDSPVIQAALQLCVYVRRYRHRVDQDSSRGALGTECEDIKEYERPADPFLMTMCRANETAFLDAEGSIAYLFPERIATVSCEQPGGYLWAGAVPIENRDSYREYDEVVAGHLHILRLEGPLRETADEALLRRVERQQDVDVWDDFEVAIKRVVASVQNCDFVQAFDAVTALPDEITEVSDVRRVLPVVIRQQEVIAESRRLVEEGEYEQARSKIRRFPDRPVELFPGVPPEFHWRVVEEHNLSYRFWLHNELNKAERQNRLKQLETALEQSKELVNVGKFSEARRTIRSLPDAPNELTELKANLLGQIEEVEKRARVEKQVEEIVEESKRLAGAGEYSEARNAIRRISDDFTEAKDLRISLLNQVDELEKRALVHKQVEEAIDQAKGLVEAGQFEMAKARICALPDEPSDLLELKTSLLGQIGEADRLTVSARSRNLQILSDLARVGITHSVIAQVAKDNKVNMSNALHLNALLEALVLQVAGLARATDLQNDGGERGQTASDPSGSSKRKWWMILRLWR